MEQFICKTRIFSGEDSLHVLPTLHIKRLLLVSDPFFYENGTVNHIAHLSQAQEVAVFHEITPDPSVSLVAKGIQLLHRLQPDTVLALGGGSAIDCAKAIAFFYGSSPRLIAVPTTSGSGSEVTNFAILTHNGRKHPLVDEKLRPDIAILDDSLLRSLPKNLIAETGFDLISHAMESWVATGSGPISQALALQALRTALPLLPPSRAGDLSARLPMHIASTMAGIAFSASGLGLCHAISHALGGAFHVPHGRLNAILLPAVMEVNTTAAPQYAHLARQLGYGTGSDSMAVRNLKNALIRLRRQLELPDTLQQCGISHAQLFEKREEVVSAALADACCATNPLPVEASMIHRVLDLVCGHG